MVGAEPRVEPRPLVMDQAVLLAVGEPSEADRRPLHVAQQALEAFSVAGLDLPIGIHGEARVVPPPHALDGLGAHLLASEHHPEE